MIQISALMHSRFRPFALRVENLLELGSHYLLITNFLTSLVLTPRDDESSEAAWIYLLFVINLVYLLLLLARIARTQFQRLRAQSDKDDCLTLICCCCGSNAAADFDALLDALEEQDRAKAASSPRVGGAGGLRSHEMPLLDMTPDSSLSSQH